MIKIWLLNLFFYKCGDNDTYVATFVATLMNTLDAAGLERRYNIMDYRKRNNGLQAAYK